MRAPDPSRIVDTLCAYWQTAALVAAIDLGLFDALGSGGRSARQLARSCRADVAATRMLCDALVSLGFLRARRGVYVAAPDAARFLDSRSADYIGGARRFFNAPAVTAAFAQLADTVRHGSPPRPVSRRPTLWATFADATASLRRQWAVDAVDELQRRGLLGGRVLDVGGGASPFGIEILRRHPSTTLIVQDRGSIADVALKYARTAGVASRVAALRGDAGRVAWGGPFDLVLMVNVLDYLDQASQRQWLEKARAALAPGGSLVVCAPLLARNGRTPREAVTYSLMLLALGGHGPASTYDDLRTRLGAAGFERVSLCASLPVVIATGRRGRAGRRRE